MLLKLAEEASVRAPAERVRAWLVNVENWPKINTKITSIAADGDRCVGEISFKGRPIEFAGIVEQPDRDTFVCHILFRDERQRENRLDVTYAVREERHATHVTETVAFLDPIPLWAGLLIKFVYRFGRSEESTNLENIARELEAG